MAQQTTTFPPGGSLQNWTPGFSSAGSPIRGIKIDNTSGSWLSVIFPGLPVQFVNPYTLDFRITCIVPLNNLTILSGGPPNSISTPQGTNVAVFASTESYGDSTGNTYYTPSAEPIRLAQKHAVPVNSGVHPFHLYDSNGVLIPPGTAIRIYGYGCTYTTGAQDIQPNVIVILAPGNIFQELWATGINRSMWISQILDFIIPVGEITVVAASSWPFSIASVQIETTISYGVR